MFFKQQQGMTVLLNNDIENRNIATNSTTKTYLICGGAGFIGSNLCHKLINEGNNVIAVDDFSTGNINNIETLLNNPQFELHNLTLPEESKFNEIIQLADVVVHFAARVGVDYAVNRPTELMLHNIITTEFIIRKCFEFDKPIFISSSSEVYGKLNCSEFKESDYSYIGHPHLFRWAYSVSKIAEEFIAYDYKRKGLKILIGRYFNLIGKNQNKKYGHVVPKFTEQANANEELTVYGDGSQRRTFCDIRDGIDAIATLLYNIDVLVNNEEICYNIGATKDISILELAKLIIELTGSKSGIRLIPESEMPEGFDEVYLRKPCLDRIKSVCDWKPKYDLIDTLQYINA